MTVKPNLLLQLDTDPQPSTFDAVVAADAGATQLLRHGGVNPDNVQGLVHGLMFTRGPEDIRRSAIFVGGSDVADGESVLRAVEACFFGPMRVSVMMDSNGCNTTASAAVLSILRHLDLDQATVTVLGGTGPVGQRACSLLVKAGARVRLGSRSLERAKTACNTIASNNRSVRIEPALCQTEQEVAESLRDSQAVIAAGAAGVQLVSEQTLRTASLLRVAVDLNAVPPAGVEGVSMTDRAAETNGLFCYGPIGVGGLKMKIHKAAVRKLFEQNDNVLNLDTIFALGEPIAAS